MGLEEDVETKSSRIIILKLEQQGTIGVIVDEVKEVVTSTSFMLSSSLLSDQ